MFKREKTTDRTPERIRYARPPAANRQVFSYYSNRQAPTEPVHRIRPKQVPNASMHLLRYVPSFFAGVAVFCSFVYILGLDTQPSVVAPARVDYPVLRDNSVYRAAAQNLFGKSVLNGNKLTVNTLEISREMQRQFPELSSVSITLPLIGRKPLVSLKPVAPAVALAGNGGVFVVSENGRAAMALTELADPDGLKIPFVTDESGLPLSAGAPALRQADITFIRTIVSQLSHAGYSVESLLMPSAAGELHVRLKDTSHVIRFNMELPPLEQAGTYLAVRKRLDREGEHTLQYVDVRVSEKVYYQ